MDYNNLKTDKERFDALNSMHYSQWSIVDDWAQQTDDPGYKKIFESTARSMYHTEEYYDGGL